MGFFQTTVITTDTPTNLTGVLQGDGAHVQSEPLVEVTHDLGGNGIIGIYDSPSGDFITITGNDGFVFDGAAVQANSGFIGDGSQITNLDPTQLSTAVPINKGGTGQTTAPNAINALVPSQTGNTGKVLGTNGTAVSWTTAAAGTVTSVAQTVPAFLSISGSPITSSGTLAIGLSGTALPIANGGTAGTTANGALNNLLPSQTSNSGKQLQTDGTNTSWVTPAAGTVTSVAATVPSVLSISGSPITGSGTLAISYSGTALPIANGGTGQTTANPAFNALAPSQTSNSGKFLTTDGTNTSWATVSVATGAVTKDITQASHGFSVGNVLKFNGTSYALAEADTAADAEVVGVVSVVINSNSFTLLLEGYLTGLSGLTAGTTYFLSPTSAGALTATAPTTVGQVNVPLLVADTTTSGFWHKYRGEVVSGAPSTASANTVYAGPTTGSPAAPNFRAIVAADLPIDVAYTDFGNIFSIEQNITRTDAGTTNTLNNLDLVHNSSGTPAAGFGVAQVFKLKDTTTTDTVAADIRVYWPATPTHGSAVGGMQLRCATAGTLTTALELRDGPKIGVLGATPVGVQTGDIGTALTTFGFMTSPSVPLPSGYIWGLVLLNDATSPNTVIDVGSGVCRDDNNTVNFSLGGFTKILNNTGSWTAGTGNNGLDTGARANSTWYHVYVISKADGSSQDVLISTSASSPTMPATYTLKRRVGAIRTDGSGNILVFTQNKDTVYLATSLHDASGVSVTTTASTQTLTVPTGLKMTAMFRLANNSTAQAILITSMAETDQAPSPSNYSIVGTSLGVSAGEFQKLTNTTAQIRLRATGTCTADIWTYGWIDTRGQ